MIRPGSWARSLTVSWVRASPQGSRRITGPWFTARMDSTAAKIGSGFMTIPAPPPNGMSSTFRWRSVEKSRRSCTTRERSPRSMALPTTPCSKTTGKRPGKIETTSNRTRGPPGPSWLCRVAQAGPAGRVHGLRDPVGDHDLARGEVHPAHRLPGGGDEHLHAAPDHPDVVGRVGEHVLDPTEVLPALGDRAQADELEVVIGAVGQLVGGLGGNVQVGAGQAGRGLPVVNLSELDDQLLAPGAAPLHRQHAIAGAELRAG